MQGILRGHPSQDVVDGVSGVVVAIGPEVTVGCRAFPRPTVTKPPLDDLDRAASGNEERSVKLSEIVKTLPRLVGRHWWPPGATSRWRCSGVAVARWCWGTPARPDLHG